MLDTLEGKDRQNESGVSYSTYNDTSPFGLRTYPVTSFKFYYILKRPTTNTITLDVRAGGLETQFSS